MMSDEKDREDKYADETHIVDILRVVNVWRTELVDQGLRDVITRIRSEARVEALREAAEKARLAKHIDSLGD